jgi:AcrR family transcriptional regulator
MSPRTITQNEEIRQTRSAQILQAARQVFAKQGFHATRMSDIAQAAGVSQGTLYHYFSSKDELFLAVLRPWNEQVAEIAQELPAGDALVTDRFWLINQIATNFFETDQDLLPVFVEYWAYIQRNPTAAAAFKEFSLMMQQSIKDILNRGIEIGEFKPVDVEILSALPLAILDGTILLTAVVGKEAINPIELLKQSQRLVFEGLLTKRGVDP